MKRKPLDNPPLVEAIVELRWALEKGSDSDTQVDPDYSLFPGRLSEKVKNSYPVHEALPAANIPDELTPYLVKHRFRAQAEGWPLIQVGPGVLTVNETRNYDTYDSFRPKATEIISILYELRPDLPPITSIMLRYIDAVNFDYFQQDLIEFLRNEMGITLTLPESLFDDHDIARNPVKFNWRSTFTCKNPSADILLGITTGKIQESPAIIWEHVVQSNELQVPQMPAGFEGWLDSAHAITDNWFFKLIESGLQRRFHND